MRKNRNTKSFKALLLIALGMGILSACCAPGVRKAPTAAQVKDTSAVQEDKTLKKEDISNESVMMDTVYGDWHVRIDTVGSKTKVKNSDEFVNKLVVTISKGGKVLFDKKVFTREDIWKKNRNGTMTQSLCAHSKGLEYMLDFHFAHQNLTKFLVSELEDLEGAHDPRVNGELVDIDLGEDGVKMHEGTRDGGY